MGGPLACVTRIFLQDDAAHLQQSSTARRVWLQKEQGEPGEVGRDGCLCSQSGRRGHNKQTNPYTHKLTKQTFVFYLFWASDEVKAAYPRVDPVRLQTDLVQSFLENDIELMVELESALQEQNNRFEPSDVSIIKDAIIAVAPDTAPVAATYRLVEPSQLESQEFQLWQIRVEHEKGNVQEFRKRKKRHEDYMYFKVLEHRLSPVGSSTWVG